MVMVKFAKDVEAQIKATIQRMVVEGLDLCELPNGGGLVLVRLDSIEYQRRLADSTVLMVPAPRTADGCWFFVCSS